MKVGVLGGTGNISASIIPLLVGAGHEVVCLNRGQSGPAPAGARWVQVDRHDRAAFVQTVRNERFDAGIDMICFNREEAEASLEAFRGVSRFIHCSTVCTYGVQFDGLPVGEDHPCRPITDYGCGKVEADLTFLEAHRSEGFPVVLLKPSTTFGPIMGLPRQIALEHSFIDRIRKGKPIVVCDDGMARHQFLHVEDAARIFVRVLEEATRFGETYNLVHPKPIPWREYHLAAMRAIGREVEQVGVPLSVLEERETPGISICSEIFSHDAWWSPEKLARDFPGWAPRISLEEGISKTIEALDREGRIPDCDALTWEDETLGRWRSLRRA